MFSPPSCSGEHCSLRLPPRDLCFGEQCSVGPCSGEHGGTTKLFLAAFFLPSNSNAIKTQENLFLNPKRRTNRRLPKISDKTCDDPRHHVIHNVSQASRTLPLATAQACHHRNRNLLAVYHLCDTVPSRVAYVLQGRLGLKL